MLWHIAVVQYVANKMISEHPQEKDEALAKSRNEIPDDVYDTIICNKVNFCRMVISCVLPFLLMLIMALAYMTYDLHPLACLVLPKRDDSIEYNKGTMEVEIKVADELLTYQIAAASISFGLFLISLFLAYLFYYLSNKIIETIMEKQKTYIYDKVNVSNEEKSMTVSDSKGGMTHEVPREVTRHAFRSISICAAKTNSPTEAYAKSLPARFPDDPNQAESC